MKLFNILAVLITLTAVFSYLNDRFIKLPTPIGVMVISLPGSLLVIKIRDKGVDPAAYFAVQGTYKLIFANCFVAEDISMEMKMSVEKAKQRALELMYRGYH